MTPTLREFLLAIGSSLPASVVVKATVILAFGLMGTRLARRSRAAVRHVLLAATFGVLLLLPVASLIVPIVRIAVPTVSTRRANSSVPAAGGEWILPFTPDAHSAVTSAASRSSRPPLSALLFMGWLAGVTLALIPMMASLWKIRSLRRSGLPWADGRKAIDRLSLESGFRRRVEVLLHEELPGPIASGMLHPAILFPPDAQTWAAGDLNRALVHELEHLRRGDVVAHCLARAICALYWFHPLVWMAWQQLILEAERSCDDAVIASSEATAYADQLVGLARRLSMAAKLPLLGMANRTDLAIRVGAVLDSRQRRGRAGMLLVAVGCAAAAVLVLTMSPLRTISEPQSGAAQVAAPTVATGAPLPTFEMASIKSDHSGTGTTRIEPPNGGHFVASNITVKHLILWAFAGVSLPLRDDQLSGGPGWINSERYDIDAKPADSQAAAFDMLSPLDRRVQFRLRVQSLLADRFKLVVKHTTEDRPAYALVIAKSGLKLQETVPGSPSPIQGPDGRPMGLWMGPDQLRAHEISVTSFAMGLSQELDRTVLDQTGLKGKYDVDLKWTPDPGSPGMMPGPSPGAGPRPDSAAPPDTSRPPIFTAIQDQLGLKLEPVKAPVEVLVIEHIERPSAN